MRKCEDTAFLETCVRNGINEMDALLHLCLGKPYSVAVVLGGCERKRKKDKKN